MARQQMENLVRDCAPLAPASLAYREMDSFTPAVHAHRLEKVWIAWDRLALDRWGLRRAIESTGVLVPDFWVTVYAICVAVATVYGRYHYGVDALAGLGVSLVTPRRSAAFPLILLTEKIRKLRRKIALYSGATTINIF